MEHNEMDNNDVVTITYKGLTFEVDVIDEIILIDPEVCELFIVDNVETQPANKFFRGLVEGWNRKMNIGDVTDDIIINS